MMPFMYFHRPLHIRDYIYMIYTHIINIHISEIIHNLCFACMLFSIHILLRVIPTMTCWVRVVKGILVVSSTTSSSARWLSFWLIFRHALRSQLEPATPRQSHRLTAAVRRATHRIAVTGRHTAHNTQDRGWGPTRHAKRTKTRSQAGTPHATRRIAGGVQHAMPNAQRRGAPNAVPNPQERGCKPARYTERTGSRLRSTPKGTKGSRPQSGAPHSTQGIAVENRQATPNSHARGPHPARRTKHTAARPRPLRRTNLTGAWLRAGMPSIPLKSHGHNRGTKGWRTRRSCADMKSNNLDLTNK